MNSLRIIKRPAAFKPMLAPHESPQTYPNYFKDIAARLPLFVSPKLDGIRCTPRNDPILDFHSLNSHSKGADRLVCKSKEGLDIPSVQVQSLFTGYQGLDGELIEGDPTDEGVYNRTQSFVMSRNKASERMAFHVFDITAHAVRDEPFYKRLDEAYRLTEAYNKEFGSDVRVVAHTLCDTLDEFLECEDSYLEQGFEGLMWRHPLSPYKWGRGTWLESYNGKLKRFLDFEAEVVGFEEAMLNTNADLRSPLGHAKRSKAKAGLVPAGTLGKLIIDYNDEELPVSCGAMKHDERKLVWDNQELYKGRWATIRHFAHGAKDRPRHPRFVGWRLKGF